MFKNSNINKWIKGIFKNNTIQEDIIAINFGFFESPKGNMVYCIGSSEYDALNSDWACNNDFVPTIKYFEPKKPIRKLNWTEFNSTMCEIIKTAIYDSVDLIPSSVKYICCGFDDGDLIVLWNR